MSSAILLAAGQSKRMNDENKLIKKIKGKPLIKHSVINILESSIDELIIITGHQNKILEKIIDKNDKIKIIFNSLFKTGMASSIKIGIKSLSKKTKAFFICLGDMPMVNKQIYNQLIKFVNNKLFPNNIGYLNEINVHAYKNKINVIKVVNRILKILL